MIQINKHMIPFFVADRQMSLRIIKGLPLQDYPNATIGIMAHANTSLNFQEALGQYPCENFDYCDAVGGPCQYQDNIENCPARNYILSHTVKMCDSGIFTKEGATLNYQEMFEAYERMDVEYGIMIDVFQDPQATLVSAEEALEFYEPYRDTFNLVGVAHGLTVEEYFECYRGLRELGFTHIAVGGLLRRVEETVRYAQVRDEAFMYEVLDAIRDEFPDDWLFALGSFHPDRLAEFQARDVWGDYKGWIFQYKKRDEVLNPLLDSFASNHLAHFEAETAETIADKLAELQNIIAIRTELIDEQKTLNQRLNQGKRTLRALLNTLYGQILNDAPDIATKFQNLTTHGLLKPNEVDFVYFASLRLNIQNTEQGRQLSENIHSNRNLKETIKYLDKLIERANNSLVKAVFKFRAADIEFPQAIQEACAAIVDIVQKSEQEHRLQQVRHKMADEILGVL